MNKMKKLLSVVLAVVLAFSALSVLGSAAVAKYKTVAELEALQAYSPYGQVTRLSSEERASMVQDFLDNVLPGLGINMGEVFNVLGLSVTIDLSSVDRLCYSLDTVADTLSNFLFTIAKGIVNLGVLEELKMNTWNTGIDRAGDSQLTLFAELFQLLSNNTGLVNTVLTKGLDLGIIGGMIGGSLDLSSINTKVKDLPGLIKGLVFPKIERWDDSVSLIKTYDTRVKGDGNVENTANERVKKLFSDNMSITTIKYDANGNMTSEHNTWLTTATGSAAPTASDSSLRYYYQINGTTMQSYHIVDAEEAEALAKDNDASNDVAAYNYVKENQKYLLEAEVEGSETYVWKAYKLDENGDFELDTEGNKIYLGTLKYYNDDSQFLAGFDANSINLTTMSAGELLYTFIPTVFDNLATVVLNGSVKKILAEFFGAQFTHAGVAGTDEVTALGDDPIFGEEQGDYVFEWSDYAIVDGVHYYRYLDDLYVADLSATNNYFDIINWEYEFTGDFMNEFVPANDDDVNDRLLLNLNDFLIKVAETITLPSAETDDTISGDTATWTRPTFVEGSNANVVENIKKAAQAVISLAPQHIFGSDYETNPRCYYDLLMSSDDDTVLLGIAAQLVDIIMPSMTLPAADEIVNSNAKVGAILAAVVREFAAYLTPEYNYDALIYADFGTTTADPVKSFVSGKDSEYWLDVILTMGINIGFEYLRAFADFGEDTTEWTAFVNYSGYKVDGGAYTEADLKLDNTTANYWEGILDFIIDWALDKDYEWTWKMENLVDTTGLTIDMTTAQDPWAKLEKILGDLLPVSEILTVNMNDSSTSRDYGTNKMEKFLRHDLILGIVDLRWDALVNTIQFNGTNNYFRTANVLDQLAKIIKGIVNGIFKKVGGGSYDFIPSAVTDFDSLASQANIRTLAVNLVGKLETAYNNGLLDTLFPFLGFLFGWKTDPQEIADLQIVTDFRNGNDYAYLYDNSKANQVQPGGAINGDGLNFTKLRVTNNSAGMLEKHRNSNVTDHAYDINIRDITSDATVNTLTFTYDNVVSPWETIDVIINGTYNGEEATTVTIEYEYVGKDGQPIGGTQYTSISFLVSNQYEDTNVEGRKSGDNEDGKYGIDPYGAYQFTEDIYTTVTTYQPSVWGTNATNGGTSNWHWTQAPADPSISSDCDGNKNNNNTPDNMNTLASTYFSYYQNRDGGWASSFEKDGSTSGKLYYAKSGVTADTEFPYGVYNMGSSAICYSSDAKVWDIVYIYYNDYDIYDVYLENKDNGYHANMGVPADVYNEYNEAWKLIVYGATYPMMTEANGHASTDYVKTIQPYIPQALEDFEAAKEAMEAALAEADANASADASASVPSYVDALRMEIDNDFMNGKEINFQDYEFYEYFNYDDVKQAAEDLYRTYIAPEVLDTYHIYRSGIREAELNFVIDGEANATKAAAIAASRRVHDQAAIDASIAARDEWQQPVNTRLYVEDFTSRLAFYKQFLNAANMEGNDHLYFLEKEIAHLEAQQLDMDAQTIGGEEYEDVSWAKFAKAYEEAKAVAADTDEFSNFNSRIYDVKYNLMVAYKQLLKKADSLIEAGGTAELLGNIEIAEGILAKSLDEIELSDVAIAKGLTKEQALGHLIEGLGYYYQARYSKHDIEVQREEKTAGELKFNDDGTPMMFNLYDESAYEYADNDRPNKQANQAKVDKVNANLEDCIAYFATAEEPAEPNTLVLKDEYADCGVIVDLEIAPMMACEDWYAHLVDAVDANPTGMIYGLDTIGYDDNFSLEAYPMLADVFTTAYGDEYLEVIAPEIAEGYDATGTVVNVLGEDGEVVETYYFVYFGDPNADTFIDMSDALDASNFAFYGDTTTTVAETLALDYNGDSFVDMGDAIELSNLAFYGDGYSVQADIAANMYASIYG
ncbi:MAG: hypothetical protein IKC45_07175 [Clostridia bacterium]|nr:hypothetical protein [Clostridia bacterium]